MSTTEMEASAGANAGGDAHDGGMVPSAAVYKITVRGVPCVVDISIPNVAKRRLQKALRSEFSEYHGIAWEEISVVWRDEFSLPPIAPRVGLRQATRTLVERILPRIEIGRLHTVVWECTPLAHSLVTAEKMS